MANFISKSRVFFMGIQLNDFINLYIHVACHRLTSQARRISLLEKFHLQPKQRQIIRYELEIAGTSSRTDNYCKSKMQDPFFRAYSRDSKR